MGYGRRKSTALDGISEDTLPTRESPEVIAARKKAMKKRRRVATNLTAGKLEDQLGISRPMARESALLGG